MCDQEGQNSERVDTGDTASDAFCNNVKLPEGNQAKPLPDKEFITKFGVDLGGEYFGRGLSMEEATAEYLTYLKEQEAKLKQRISDLSKA